MTDTNTLQEDLKKLNITSGIFSALIVVVLSVVFSSSVWLTFRVVQLTDGLQRSNDKLAAQQVTLKRQQKSLDKQQTALEATQRADARRNCETVNESYRTSRALVRAESVVQVRQAISLYERSQQTARLNPPKNDQARAARVVSERFLHDLATDTYTAALKAITDVDAKTKPLTC